MNTIEKILWKQAKGFKYKLNIEKYDKKSGKKINNKSERFKAGDTKALQMLIQLKEKQNAENLDAFDIDYLPLEETVELLKEQIVIAQKVVEKYESGDYVDGEL